MSCKGSRRRRPGGLNTDNREGFGEALFAGFGDMLRGLGLFFLGMQLLKTGLKQVIGRGLSLLLKKFMHRDL